jgi:hypothetical protein
MTSCSTDRYSQLAMNGLHPGSAFIIQFRTDSDPRAVRLAGRIEHVASGKTATFDSLHDVPELLLQMLQDSRQADADRL